MFQIHLINCYFYRFITSKGVQNKNQSKVCISSLFVYKNVVSYGVSLNKKQFYCYNWQRTPLIMKSIL